MSNIDAENSIDHQKFRCGAVHGENMTNQSAVATTIGKARTFFIRRDSGLNTCATKTTYNQTDTKSSPDSKTLKANCSFAVLTSRSQMFPG